MKEDGVPSVNPKLDAMCEMLKTIHDLNERNKQLEAQIEKMRCCNNCFYDCEDCNSKNKDCNKCSCGTCVKHNHWELRG